jgi:7-cyano-7-deazaguanine synthase
LSLLEAFIKEYFPGRPRFLAVNDKKTAKSPINSVVLVSGGLDSAVTASVAAANGEVAFCHINYGQKTEARELSAFNDLAEHFGVKEKLAIDLAFLKEIGGSALTDSEIAVPDGDLSNKEIPPTYVPFRNALLLSVAVSWAERLGAGNVFIGAVEEDSSGYPDCRSEFLASFEETARLGTRPDTEINIKAPLVEMKRTEIVKLGVSLNTPFHLTWSCYKDKLLACGKCDSCLLRLKGFREAGITDPIPYK